jgi:hypothetical protein
MVDTDWKLGKGGPRESVALEHTKSVFFTGKLWSVQCTGGTLAAEEPLKV